MLRLWTAAILDVQVGLAFGLPKEFKYVSLLQSSGLVLVFPFYGKY